MGATTEQELTDYRDRLNTLKTRLTDYGKLQGDIRFEHTCQDSVLLVAIEGLLTKLQDTDSAKVTLNEIVHLADSVTEVIKSAEQFLSSRVAVTRRY